MIAESPIALEVFAKACFQTLPGSEQCVELPWAKCGKML